MVAGTLRTNSFHDIIAGPGIISFRQYYRRDVDIVKTEGPVTSFAVEMHVGVLVVIGVVA